MLSLSLSLLLPPLPVVAVAVVRARQKETDQRHALAPGGRTGHDRQKTGGAPAGRPGWCCHRHGPPAAWPAVQAAQPGARDGCCWGEVLGGGGPERAKAGLGGIRRGGGCQILAGTDTRRQAAGRGLRGRIRRRLRLLEGVAGRGAGARGIGKIEQDPAAGFAGQSDATGPLSWVGKPGDASAACAGKVPGEGETAADGQIGEGGGVPCGMGEGGCVCELLGSYHTFF